MSAAGVGKADTARCWSWQGRSRSFRRFGIRSWQMGLHVVSGSFFFFFFFFFSAGLSSPVPHPQLYGSWRMCWTMFAGLAIASPCFAVLRSAVGQVEPRAR